MIVALHVDLTVANLINKFQMTSKTFLHTSLRNTVALPSARTSTPHDLLGCPLLRQAQRSCLPRYLSGGQHR